MDNLQLQNALKAAYLFSKPPTDAEDLAGARVRLGDGLSFGLAKGPRAQGITAAGPSLRWNKRKQQP